jgi:hypothetical protein
MSVILFGIYIVLSIVLTVIGVFIDNSIFHPQSVLWNPITVLLVL